MNDPIPIHELLALLGQKELEIHMLRKALAKFQDPPAPPGSPQTPNDPLPHHPV